MAGAGAGLAGPDNVFVNCLVSNSSGELAPPDTLAVYQENRNDALLSRASEYQLAVARASISGATRYLPIHVAPIQTGQADPTLTTWVVGASLSVAGLYNPVSPAAVTIVAGVNDLLQAYARSPSGAWITLSTGNPITLTPGAYNAATLATELDAQLTATGIACTVAAVDVLPTAAGGPFSSYLVITPSGGSAGWQIGLGCTSAAASAGAGLVVGLPAASVVWASAAGEPLTMPNIIRSCDGAGTPEGEDGSWTYSTSRQVVWAPEWANVATPAAPTTAQADSPYYWLQTVPHFVKLINTALSALWADLQTAYTAFLGASGFTQLPTQPLRCAPPVLSFAGGVFSLSADRWGFGSSLLPRASSGLTSPFFSEAYGLYFNDRLWRMLGNIDAARVTPGVAPAPANCNWLVDWAAASAGTMPTAYSSSSATIGALASSVTTVPALVLTQSAPSTSSWSPVSSIVLASTDIPSRPESLTPPVQSDVSNLATGASTAVQLPILTDIAPGIGAATDWQESLVYAPTFPRWSDLLSSGEVRTLGITALWADTHGTLRPLYLPPGGSFYVKLWLKRRTA